MRTRARIADLAEMLYRTQSRPGGYTDSEIEFILIVQFDLDEYQIADWLPPIIKKVKETTKNVRHQN
jgi:hypothetical protein